VNDNEVLKDIMKNYSNNRDFLSAFNLSWRNTNKKKNFIPYIPLANSFISKSNKIGNTKKNKTISFLLLDLPHEVFWKIHLDQIISFLRHSMCATHCHYVGFFFFSCWHH
jgi:hypothetical protein